MKPYFIPQINTGYGWYDLTVAKEHLSVESAKRDIDFKKSITVNGKYRIIKIESEVVWEDGNLKTT